jgi:1,4-dihydroxy-2-naphthoate octaprenyltransferase
MKKNVSVMQSMRLPFLVLSPVCVLLAVAIASYQQVYFSMTHVFISLIGALAAHIAVNTINEYQDFISGLDFKTKQTPFSGGSGLLPENPSLAKKVLTTGIISVLLTSSIGCYFVYFYGWAIMPLGLLGLIIVITYTQWLNRSALLCLIAPGLGFGSLIIGGTYFCITGSFNNSMWVITLIPFLLINNLLLLNQYPDIEADKSIGRNHFPIKYGVKASTTVYILSSVSAQLLLVYLVIATQLPIYALLAILPMLLGYVCIAGMVKLGSNIASEPKFLAMNVACSVLTPLVLAIALFI